MPRPRLDVLLATLGFAAAATMAWFLVWHVDSSPSRVEQKACAYTQEVRAALAADAPVALSQARIRRLAHLTAAVEDAPLRRRSVDARVFMHRYHYELVHAGASPAEADARPTLPSAGTPPGAVRAWARVHRALTDTFAACQRLELAPKS